MRRTTSPACTPRHVKQSLAERLAAARAQIIADQQTNAKRDEEIPAVGKYVRRGELASDMYYNGEWCGARRSYDVACRELDKIEARRLAEGK